MRRAAYSHQGPPWRRYPCRGCRPRHQDIGRARKPRDRRQIAVDIIGRAMDQRPQADRPDGRGQQRIAIWRGLGDDIRTDAAACASAIFRNDRLAKPFRKPLCHQATNLVRRLSWRPGYHQANGSCWPGLCLGWPDQKWQRCQAKCAAVDHDAFPHPDAILTHWRVSASGQGFGKSIAA